MKYSKITKAIFRVLAVVLICVSRVDAGSLGTSVDGVNDPKEPEWYLSPVHEFDLEPFWKNSEIPVSKRLAVFKHISDRLVYTERSCPNFEEEISLKLEDVSIDEALDEIEKALGAKIPREIDVKAEIRFSVDASEFRVYHIIESLCIDSGLDLAFTPTTLRISEPAANKPVEGTR